MQPPSLSSSRASARVSARKAASRVVGAALVCNLVRCQPERTQIVLAIDTDYGVTAQLGAIRVTVIDPITARPSVRTIALEGLESAGCREDRARGSYCVPLTMLLVPTSGRASDTPVDVTVEGVERVSSQAALVSRRARLRFAWGRTLRLPMFLSRDCGGVVCPADFTCVQGARCEPVDQPVGVVELDPRTGLPRDAGAPDALDGAVARDGQAEDGSSLDDAALDARVDGGATVGDSALDGSIAPCPDGRCPMISSIAAGRDFTCARLSDGHVACWGANDRAQLGRGTITPLLGDGSGGLERAAWVSGLSRSTTLALGATHACVATTNDTVRCWGANSGGSLGVGSSQDAVSAPLEVPFFSESNGASRLALGAESTYVQTPRGLYAWGSNLDRALGVQPGTIVTAPVMMMDSAQVRWISARERGMCWIDRSEARCVGLNAGQRFGAIAGEGATLETPQAIAAGVRRDTITLGPSFACGIAASSAACWGANLPSGVLGAPPPAGAPRTITAAQTVRIDGSSVTELAAGASFVLARTSNGAVWCWGANDEGQCATGARTAGSVSPASVAPMRVVFPSGFSGGARAIVAGDAHACAVDAQHAVWCWGRNRNGQTGAAVSSDPATRLTIAPRPVAIPST